jgi:ammonium transporter Rh
MKWPKATFSSVLFVFQVILLVLFAVFAEYETVDAVNNSKYYPTFQDVHTMIFIGFGFLMTFLEKYSYSAIGYNMLISAICIQWSMFLNAWMHHAIKGKEYAEGEKAGAVKINVQTMILSDFTCGAVLITFGAIIGKVSRLQLLIIGVVECVFFALNEAILIEKLHISDVGGSIVIHAFGAYFGLAVSYVTHNHLRLDDQKESATKHSDVFAMIGTIFLWMYWPSFNGAMLGEKPYQQNRAFVNTYISLAASCVGTFLLSPLLDKEYKMKMAHIQNATIAGGVAIGSCADLAIQPWGACLLGLLAGFIGTAGVSYLTPFLNKKVGLHDTCGVHNLHGLPGLLSMVAASIAAAVIPASKYVTVGKNNEYFTNLYGARADTVDANDVVITKGITASKQGGMQAASIFVGLCLAIGGGIVAGTNKLFLYNFFI